MKHALITRGGHISWDVVDIEDLVEAGKATHKCPYYM
jgi:hypothetical protein